MTEQEELTVNAQLSALTFLVEVLMANLIAAHPTREHGERFIADLRKISKRTGGFQAGDEHAAAAIAELAVETQERIGHILDRAVERVG